MLLWLLVSAVGAARFVSLWSILSSNETLTLPFSSSLPTVSVSWGDGTTNVFDTYDGVVSEISHIYLLPNNYTIEIEGRIHGFSFATFPDEAPKLLEILSWGDFAVGTRSVGVFSGCKNLHAISAPDQPFFEQYGASLDSFFKGCEKLNSELVWVTYNVTNMHAMFAGASIFNSLIHFSSTSFVTDMSEMFMNATAFNQNLVFDTPSVLTFEKMFFGAYSFNPQMLTFANSSQVKTTAFMFADARSFNMQQLELNTNNTINMQSMFEVCGSFSGSVNFTSTRAARNMNKMFFGATRFRQNLNDWSAVLVSSCDKFCPSCGLPTFALCSPCGGGVNIVQITNGVAHCFGYQTDAPAVAGPTQMSSLSPTPMLGRPSRAPTSAPSDFDLSGSSRLSFLFVVLGFCAFCATH